MILPLVITYLVDTSLVKIYDIISKSFMASEFRILLFSLNSAVCLILQYFVLKYLKNFNSKKVMKINFNSLYSISLLGVSISGILIFLIIFQMYFYNQYEKNLIQITIITNYGIAFFFMIKLAILFISWFKIQQKLIFLLYCVTILLIGFNLLATSYYAFLKISDRPQQVGKFVGGSIDISYGKYTLVEMIYKISSMISFIFMWIVAALLMTNYKDRPLKAIAFWMLLSLPMIYFVFTYVVQPIISILLYPFLNENPILITLLLTFIQTFSKPIGGLTFVILFWSISRNIKYEKDIGIFMSIAGIGVMLMFATNQATNLAVTPYPPYGILTITIINIASFLMLLGIYYSAILASTNMYLRNSIDKHKSKLIDLIGKAEMEKEIQKTVTKILHEVNDYRKPDNIKAELDEDELKKYLDQFIKELKKSDNKS